MMKKQLKLYLNKHSIYYILGLFILATGICLIIDSKLGASPWDLLCLGLYNKTGISVGTWQIINNIVMIIITKGLFQKKWNFICLIPGVLLGLFIDIMYTYTSLITLPSMISLMMGCMMSGLGLAIYIHQGLSANAIDNFMHSLQVYKRLSTGTSKIICDFIPISIILLLGIQLQIATILIYVLVPLWMQAFYKLLQMKPTLLVIT